MGSFLSLSVTMGSFGDFVFSLSLPVLSPLTWVANENYVCDGHDFGNWCNVDSWMLVTVGHYGGLMRTTLKREKLRSVG